MDDVCWKEWEEEAVVVACDGDDCAMSISNLAAAVRSPMDSYTVVAVVRFD